MEKLLIAIVILLAIIVIGLMVVVSIFLFKLIKIKESQQESHTTEGKYSSEVQDLITNLKGQKQIVGGQFCTDHPELPAKGKCSISEEPYCELCLSKEGEVRLARKNLDLYLDFEWEDFDIVSDKDTGADILNLLVKTKKDLWNGPKIPIITQKQFKINIENDEIEAYTVIKMRTQDKNQLGNKLDFIKS